MSKSKETLKKGVPEEGQKGMVQGYSQEGNLVEGKEIVLIRKLEEKEKRKDEGQGEENQVSTPSNTGPNEYTGDLTRDKVQEMCVDVSEGEGEQEIDNRQEENEVEKNSTGESGKILKMKESLKENVGTGRKPRLAKGTMRGRGAPLTEKSLQSKQFNLREKRKTMLRDEPEDMIVDSEPTEQGRTKVQKKEVQLETLLRVTEAIPKGPPMCQ